MQAKRRTEGAVIRQARAEYTGTHSHVEEHEHKTNTQGKDAKRNLNVNMQTKLGETNGKNKTQQKQVRIEHCKGRWSDDLTWKKIVKRKWTGQAREEQH